MAEEAPSVAEALNVNDATALLDRRDAEEQSAEAQDAPAEEIEAQPSAEDADAPEEASDGEDEASDAEAQPPVAKPRSWAADDDELWNGIPRGAQEKILAREEERDSATDRALQQAADARKQAEGHIQTAAQIKASLDAALPQAQRVFQSKWSNWTPENRARIAAENPAQYNVLREQFEAEQAQLANMTRIQQDAETLTFQEFVRTEAARLPTVCPDLADEKEGPARKAALATFLTKAGFDEDTIRQANADMLAIAYDAMRYRAGFARLAAPKSPALAAKPLKPAGSAPAPSPKRQATEALNRLAQTGRVEDAVAYMNSKG